MTTVKIAVSKYRLDKKIQPGDSFWREFNGSFRNVELETEHILQAIYDGHPITTWHKDCWRNSANYLAGQHIGLDFDTEDQRSTLAALLQDKFIRRYAAFIHTTISHKDEAPRARVIFTLDTPIIQSKNYVLAAQSLLWLYGTADRACSDSARFFYGAPGCTFEYLDNVLPIETLKKLISQYQETGRQEHKKASNKDYHAPASQQEVAEALRFIPPWQIGYDEWLEVLMGIHSQFGAAGLGLAENWADGKRDTGGGLSEVERKFKSFDQTGNDSGAVTIATVFGIAKKFGWKKAVVL